MLALRVAPFYSLTCAPTYLVHVVVAEGLHLLLVLFERGAEPVHLGGVGVRVRVWAAYRVRTKLRCAVRAHPLEEKPVLGGELGGVLLLCAVVLGGDGVALSLLGQLEVECLVACVVGAGVGIRDGAGLLATLGLGRVGAGVGLGLQLQASHLVLLLLLDEEGVQLEVALLHALVPLLQRGECVGSKHVAGRHRAIALRLARCTAPHHGRTDSCYCLLATAFLHHSELLAHLADHVPPHDPRQLALLLLLLEALALLSRQLERVDHLVARRLELCALPHLEASAWGLGLRLGLGLGLGLA